MTTGSDETVVLDANEFMPSRVEVDLNKLGLDIIDAKWGDAEHEVFLVRQELGEIPANSHPPNRNVELKLRAKKEGAETLADILTRLQQKVGTLNRRHGWVKRVLDSKGGYAVPVGAVVYRAVLGGVEGWLMAHRGVAHELTLTLEISPYFYSTTEDKVAEVKTETGTARQVSYEVADTGGSAPGLRRVVVKNLDASTDWRGFLWAEQSDDLIAGAADTYEAESLNLLNGSVKAAKAESTTEAVKNSGVMGLWTSILGTGPMTHQGVKHVWLRALSEFAGLELRLIWRPLGSPQFYENDVAAIPVTESWMLLDLGEIRIDAPIIGEQKWEGYIYARVPHGSPAGTVYLDRLGILPTEQYMLVTEPSDMVFNSVVKTKPPGANGKAWGESEYFWENLANVKAKDGSYSKCLTTWRWPTPMLYTESHGFVLPAGAVVAGVGVSITRKQAAAMGAYDREVSLFVGGAPAGNPKWIAEIWSTSAKTVSYGGPTDLWGLTSITKAQVEAAGFGAGIAVKAISESPATVEIDCIEVTVYYYVPAEVSDEAKVCFAGREAQLRSEGVFRQHKTSNVWGHLPFIGFLPHAVPSGLEAQPCRGIIIPSSGDFGEWPDSGSGHKMSVTVYTRKAYHFASEAS